jgi:hypothetical protein
VVPCVRELRYLSSNTKENEECSFDEPASSSYRCGVTLPRQVMLDGGLWVTGGDALTNTEQVGVVIRQRCSG